MFGKTIRNYLPLIFIIILAIFLRFAFLDKVPNAIGGDEIVYVLNSKALFLTGHDIFGSWSPINGLMFQYPKGETQAELPYLLYSISVGSLPFSIFAAHLTNAILGIVLIIFVFLVTKELLGEKIAIFASFVASINPWLIFIGRTAYEAIPVTFFYFISLYILLKAKSWKILVAFPFLMFAFYSYIATKLIFLPFVAVAILYSYYVVNKRKYTKQFTVLFILCIVFVAFYFVSLKLNPQTARLGEILTPNSQGISDQVNRIRENSIQSPLTNLLVNKYSIFINLIFIKTLKTFASDYLFVNGDEFFSIWRNGLFYYIDSIFLILGLLFLFIRKRAVFFLITVLGLIGVIPQVFHTAETDNFSIHAAMTYPFLIILIGVGIFAIVNYFKNKNLKLASFIVIIVLYAVSTINFFNIYTFWYPLQGYFDFQVRIASSYSVRASQNQKVTIFSTSSFDYFKKFLFYSNWYNKQTSDQVAKNLNSGQNNLRNVYFESCNLPNLKNKNEVSLIDSKCGEPIFGSSHLVIPQLKDGGQRFVIYNDLVCKGASLRTYPSNFKMSDFDIEKLSDKQFCEKFIVSQ